MTTTTNNDKLFFLIWRNGVIRNEIFKNIHSTHCNFIDRDFKIFKDKGYQEWIDYQYKDRIETIYLFIGGRDSITVNFNRVKTILKSMDGSESNLKSVTLELSSHGYQFPIDFVNDLFPSSIEHLKLIGYFKSTLPMDTFSKNKNLKSVTLFNSFDQPLVISGQPKRSLFGNCNNLTYLNFCDFCGSFDKKIPVGALPSSLLTLKLSYMFNKRIDEGVLPCNLTNLVFGEHFNSYISKLPSSLKVLEFGRDYNKPIGLSVLPNGLEKLVFNIDFNQRILPNSLPNSLKHLVFGHGFNFDLPKGILPESLTTLEFDGSGVFTKSIDISNLNQLSTLSLFRCCSLKQVLNLPNSITNLKFGCTFENLDTLIKSLSPLVNLISLDITNVQKVKTPIVMGQLPVSLTNLKYNLNNSFTKNSLLSLVNLSEITSPSFTNLPNTITHFNCSYSFMDRISKNDVPLNIVHLNFHGCPNVNIDHGALVNCVNLTSLHLGSFNQPIGETGKLFFPKNLIHLQFGHQFNSNLNCTILPTTLKSLQINGYYQHTLGGLPNSLMLLSVPYSGTISNDTLPNSLQHLILPIKSSKFDKGFNVPSQLTIYTVHDNYSIVYNIKLFNQLFNNLKLSNKLEIIYKDLKNKL